MENNIQSLATKTGLLMTKEDLQKEIGVTRKEISAVREEIGEAKADTIKWIFIFWIGQIGALLAIVCYS